ncbi:hypothetical protein [Methyloversatilis discipulorum]|uniref:hypothetical protein n=1 Tax=Methyloversatilis discipulorum TaxID=1119528 RepID=UPI001A3FAA52|nr:hypothetical protein [Methyloversatilis discipulorum]MBL8469681.1 hypothetical protein [Methyloversatilis discipulorum]
MLLADHRWLAADKTADALTARYLAALAPDWYERNHEDTARLRSRLLIEHRTAHDMASSEREILRMFDEAEFSLSFYKRRCDALQGWQSRMRDPERTVVCDILANGCTLPAEHAGDRYEQEQQT